MTYSWVNGGFNETQLLHRRDHSGGSWLTLIVPDSFRTMQLQGIPRLSVSRLWALCGRPPYSIYCVCDRHSLLARVWKHARQNIWKMSTDVHVYIQLRVLLDLAFTSIFCLWYFIIETEVRLCSLCPGNLICGIRPISPKVKQSNQMKFDHYCFMSRCALMQVLLFYGECLHLISDSTEVLALIPSQVFTVEFAWSPHDSGIPLGSPVLGGQKTSPQIRNKQW